MKLGSGQLFRRVTIRRRVGDQIADIVGRIVAENPSALTIESRTGELVVVDRDSIIASRFIADKPVRTRPAARFTADELTEITSHGWPAIESVPLGPWKLRASGGFTRRANSVAAIGLPDRADYATATEQIRAFYRARSLPPLAHVVWGTQTQRDLISAGWRRDGSEQGAGQRTAVLVTDGLRQQATDPDIALSASLGMDWLTRYQPAVHNPTAAIAVLTGPPVVGFLTYGQPVTAIARVAVTGEWAGITALEVDPVLRRTGVGTRLVMNGLTWAGTRGADKFYAQVRVDNTASLALFDQLGFTSHHDYDYLTVNG